MVVECQTEEDLSTLVAQSEEKPVFLYKHSTRCPISASRWSIYQKLAERERRAAFGRVLVIENRSLSTRIAEETGVEHESPQVVLLHQGRVVWHASHWSVTDEQMVAELARLISG